MIRVAILLLASSLTWAEKPVVKVGSKTFTESYILAEIISQIVEKTGEAEVERKHGLGATGILFAAIENGEIDIYPEYTGTISEQLLKRPNLKSVERIRAALLERGLTLSESLGFNNTYAIGVRREEAEKRGLEKVSDLKGHEDLRVATGHEFLTRKDGFKAMQSFYGFSMEKIEAMEHALGYEAIRRGKADLIDVYSTDAKIQKLNLKVLEDDRGFFPTYHAVLLVRKDFTEKFPRTWAALRDLEGSIDESRMVKMNSARELDKVATEKIAADFTGSGVKEGSSFIATLKVRTWQHLYLVLVSLLAAVIVGVPLGIMAAKWSKLSQGTLLVTGLIQTIPSLALLCFMIPLLGTGALPSLVALFLYGLLPIVRNTFQGLKGIDPELHEAAFAMNLTPSQKLRLIELPLASPGIMSGIKTSAIINVGTATIAALIGAGGYGDFIVEGLTRNDIPTILYGAVPAACLAMLLHGLFEGVDRLVIPKGIRT